MENVNRSLRHLISCWRGISSLLVVVGLSGCSITVEHFLNVDNLKATDRGLLFTVGRTEFRHFAMADKESHTVLRATASLYSVSPEQVKSGAPLTPLLQQDAMSWMDYLADTNDVVVDSKRKTLQSARQQGVGTEALIPPNEQASGLIFGRDGYFYLAGTALTPTYVAAGGTPCTISLANIQTPNPHYFLSGDGRYVAVIANRNNVANNAPLADVAVELFQGCTPMATHQIQLTGGDRFLGVCVADGAVWYNVWHWYASPEEREWAWRYGTDDRLELVPDQVGRYVWFPSSFDCANQQFVWLELEDGGDIRSLNASTVALIHRYQPVSKKHEVTKLKLVTQ